MLLIVKLLWEKLSKLLSNLFGSGKPDSRVEAKQRLKLVIAHDRAGLSSEAIEAMRREILAVVARYVDIDIDESEFSLSSDDRMTSLIANLPIRRIRAKSLDSTEDIAQAVKAEGTELDDADVSAELITDEPIVTESEGSDQTPDVEGEPEPDVATDDSSLEAEETSSDVVPEETSTEAESPAKTDEEANDSKPASEMSDQ